MFRVFGGVSADEVWREIASAFVENDNLRDCHSRCGPVRELGPVALSILDPRQRWVVCREPPMNPAFAVAEVVWIVNGRNDASFLNYFNRQLPRFAGRSDTYPGAYGYRLRKHLGLDQLDRAHHALKGKPEARQVVLQIWDSRVDLPDKDGTPASADIPCNIISLLKLREERLEWTQVLRSNDLFRGLPHNLVQFTALQEIVAGWLGVACGSFHLMTDSVHVYNDCLTYVCSSGRVRAQQNMDDLAVNRQKSESAFRELARRVETIIDRSVEASQLRDAVYQSQLPPAFVNLLCVLTAEGLRRRGDADLELNVMEKCTNPLLLQLWGRWLERLSPGLPERQTAYRNVATSEPS